MILIALDSVQRHSQSQQVSALRTRATTSFLDIRHYGQVRERSARTQFAFRSLREERANGFQTEMNR